MAVNRRIIYALGILLLLSLYLINVFQMQVGDGSMVFQADKRSSHKFMNLLSTEEEKKAEVKVSKTDPAPSTREVKVPYCPGVTTCPAGSSSYTLHSGFGMGALPYICINGKNVTHLPSDVGRGLNVAVVDGSLTTILSRNIFDTYGSKFACYEFVEFATSEVPTNSYIFITSFDDMTTSFCNNGQQMLEVFGSQAIKTVKFRDTYIFIGRKGAPKPIVEQVGKGDPKVKSSFGTHLKSSGCIEVIHTVYDKVDPPPLPDLPDCGIACAYDEVSILVSTGYMGKTRPKLCIGNEYVFGPQIRGGRGFNMAVVCPYSKNVVKRMYFDAYKRETSPIDTFLLDIPDGFLLVGVTHDDVFTSLGNYTRALFKTFGITLVDTIKMRSVMYFAGRKGMRVSRFQNVSHVPENGSKWPTPINKRFCLPLVLKEEDKEIKAITREQFCSKNDGFFHFCFGDNKMSRIKFYEPWAALPQSGFDKDIYDVPILLLASFNKEAVAEALNTLAAQPGVKKDRVFIAYPSIFDKDYKTVTNLFFGDNSTLPITTFSSYHLFLEGAMQEAWKKTNSTYLIVIDEDILPSRSFQFYMGQMLPSLKKGEASVVGASNENTFTFMSGSPSQLQYIDHFPTSAFMLTSHFYNSEMKGKFLDCCSLRSWQGWFPRGFTKLYNFVIPEVSRAVYFDPDSYLRHRHNPSTLFHPQAISGEPTLLNLVTRSQYIASVSKAIKMSPMIDSKPFLAICNIATGIVEKLKFVLNFHRGENIVLQYGQQQSNDLGDLIEYYMCLNLTQGLHTTPFSSLQGMTRIHFDNKYLYIIGDKTPLV